jgi:hypothetical protein
MPILTSDNLLAYDTDNREDVAALLAKKAVPAFPEVWPRRTVYGSAEAFEIGLTPIESVPDVLIQPSDYGDALKLAHEQKNMPIYHMQATWCPVGQRYSQDGLGYCAPADTEVLTSSGWKLWPDYNWRDLLATVNPFTHAMEFQFPTQKHVYEYDGDLVCSTNRRLDFRVTPDHMMYVRRFDDRTRSLSTAYNFVRAADLGWYSGFMHAPSGFLGTHIVALEVPGDRRYDGDDFISLIALILSDGYIGASESTRGWVSFCCFDERYESVARLASRCGFAETKSRSGVWTRFSAHALWTWIKQHCYRDEIIDAATKQIPGLFKWLSERQIKHFLTWYGDQAASKPMSMYYSSSKHIVADLQELLLRVGKRSTPSWRPARTSVMKDGKAINGRPNCTLVVSDTDRLCIDRRKHIEQEHYKGLVYCATVPNHTLITRRNGSVLISSNCWTWSGTGCMMTTRACEDKDTQLLAPVSMGYLVNWSNSGNYLESYIKGAREQGVCPAKDWAEVNSTNRSKKYWEEVNQRAKYRLDKVWDLRSSAMTQHCISTHCYGRTIYGAWNWWSHAVELCGIRMAADGKLEWLLHNSHNESDVIVLTGSKAVPDEAYGFISTVLYTGA